MANQTEITEQTRALALKFVKIGTTRKLTQLSTITHPDAQWTISIDKAMAGYGGSQLASETFAEAESHMKDFERYTFEAQSMVIDGDKAFIDVAAEGFGPGPVEYHQNYAFFLKTAGGKIMDVKVWSDPFQVKAWAEAMQKYQSSQ